jgi:hypothetical protein
MYHSHGPWNNFLAILIFSSAVGTGLIYGRKRAMEGLSAEKLKKLQN